MLDAVATALRLDDVERRHLHDLARPARRTRRPAPSRPETVRPRLRQLVDGMRDVPAIVLGRRHEVLAWNALGHALLAGHLDPTSPDRPADRPSLSRLLFLDQHTRDLYPRWADEARAHVAYLRLVAGRHPDDPRLAALIGELSMKSPDFAELWHQRRVRDCSFGVKEFTHPLVGPMTLAYEVMQQPDHADRTARCNSLARSPGPRRMRPCVNWRSSPRPAR